MNMFTEPEIEVVRFGNGNIITASTCSCDVGGIVFPVNEGSCEGDTCPSNIPVCDCEVDTVVNCY